MISHLPMSSYKKRVDRVQNHLVEKGTSGLFVSNPYNIFYMTGLFHFPTERPIALFVPQKGEPIFFIPIMELEEAKRVTIFKDIRHYFEYPGPIHPIDWMVDEIKGEYSNLSNISLDSGSHELFTQIKERFNGVSISFDSIVHTIRLTKDSEEIELLKNAAIYADFIVKSGMDIAEPGISELELLQEMSNRTLSKMVFDLDEVILVPGGPAGGLVPSGDRTAMPHALPSAKKLQKGETQILSCGANVGGYRVECERTCFIGDVSQEQEKVFNVMAEAQQMAIEAMRPGMTCAEVDSVALDHIRKAGYGKYLLHRTGHGKGLEEHEAPWIDEGDHTVLQPGMVLSSEPGIYIEGFSGFRHSDTVVVTDNEPLILTKFPRSIEELIIK
ncbi:M24 family metallopeptidase [Virgibacillus byunsanensis]|uniref:M24 family metallopeptidase n=1 Tax=Virgibacillus byunsanensis TaxID=570945 RepID=A0ABW3LKR8_9BACI